MSTSLIQNTTSLYNGGPIRGHSRRRLKTNFSILQRAQTHTHIYLHSTQRTLQITPSQSKMKTSTLSRSSCCGSDSLRTLARSAVVLLVVVIVLLLDRPLVCVVLAVETLMEGRKAHAERAARSVVRASLANLILTTVQVTGSCCRIVYVRNINSREKESTSHTRTIDHGAQRRPRRRSRKRERSDVNFVRMRFGRHTRSGSASFVQS